MIEIKIRFPVYPFMVGVLLGLMQTGLFFQLTFTLSSSFGSYLLVTLCWIGGSAFGVMLLAGWRVPLWGFLLLALAGYGLVSGILISRPFDTRLWVFYAVLIGLTGVYPGVFFARMAAFFTARTLFLWENNGFIAGLLGCTLLFMAFGRVVLWVVPVMVAVLILFLGAWVCAPVHVAKVE
jgi:hypothetical protein